MEEISYLDSLLTTGFDEPYDHSIDTIDPDEPTDLPGITVTDGFETTEEDEEAFDTMIDLDRDMPGFEGTMDALEDMVDGVVGEPEFLGGR